MKKITLFMIALLLLSPVKAKDLKVLLDSRRTLEEITFLENYAIVINKDHYYGPISKNNRLKVEIAEGGKIRLYLRYTEKDKNGKEQYKYKNLGTTSARIDIVRGFENGIDFTKVINPKNPISKNIEPKYLNLSKQAQKSTPFFRYKTHDLSGWIEYSGPLSLFVRAQSKDSFYLVETIPLEKYLVQVTNCEMRIAKNIEAYKAQSILARTFAIQKIKERQNKTNWLNFQLLPDERDQAYICEMRVKNNTPPDQAVKDAVKTTKNLVLGKNNALLEIHYCAYCGNCAYCSTTNHCKTKNGMGSCQNGIAYYSRQKGYTYEKLLKKYHPDAKIYTYNEKDGHLANSSMELQNELEDNLRETEKRLQKMI
ncbi:MAG: hypothetical protein II972_01325 [Elusimicrobiaceae bacterium]|nr:hypothetical protein [Elusimicrobiaceae bacterium]